MMKKEGFKAAWQAFRGRHNSTSQGVKTMRRQRQGPLIQMKLSQIGHYRFIFLYMYPTSYFYWARLSVVVIRTPMKWTSVETRGHLINFFSSLHISSVKRKSIMDPHTTNGNTVNGVQAVELLFTQKLNLTMQKYICKQLTHLIKQCP